MFEVLEVCGQVRLASVSLYFFTSLFMNLRGALLFVREETN